jgi:hypothetical protein
MKFWSLLVAVTLASLVGTNAYANKQECAKHWKQKMTAADVFKKMDSNHDGKVTLDEYKAFHKKLDPKKAEERFQKMTGGQKILTLDEFQKAWAEHAKAWHAKAQHAKGSQQHTSVGWGT